MNDLISRQAAVDYFVTNVGWHDEDGYPVEDSDELRKIWTDLVNGVPSTQPEIIRCKDCKHYDGRPCGIVDWYNTADDFCSKAERRTDG